MGYDTSETLLSQLISSSLLSIWLWFLLWIIHRNSLTTSCSNKNLSRICVPRWLILLCGLSPNENEVVFGLLIGQVGTIANMFLGIIVAILNPRVWKGVFFAGYIGVLATAFVAEWVVERD